MRTWVDVAQLVKTRNLDGGFVVQCTAGLPFLLSENLTVAFVPPQTDVIRSATVESCEPIDGNRCYVKFAEVTDVDTARALVGSHCLARRADLPEYAAAVGGVGVIGWTVRDVNEGVLGTVSEIVENVAQSLMEVERSEGGSVLIPLVEEFIVGIDEDACEVTVQVPEGLTQL